MKLTPKTANFLFILMIIVVVCFIIFTLSFMISNKKAFTENPFIYGAKKMGLGQCYCNCYNMDNLQPISFYFNQSYFEQKLQGG